MQSNQVVQGILTKNIAGKLRDGWKMTTLFASKK